MACQLCEHAIRRSRAGLRASLQRRSGVRHAQVTPDAPDRASTSYVEAELDGKPGRRVQLAASTSGHRTVEEGAKPLSEYMALPASQYSVLDGSQVERLGGDTFRVFVPAFKFFAIEVQPVLTLQVEATERGCVISMLACKLRGSKLVEAQNTQFAARMRNTVAWQECATPACDDITSDVRIDVDLVVPKWFVLPKTVVRTTGNAVMAAIVNAAVPKFLEQLEADYRAWAAGDESRQPMSDGELLSAPEGASASGHDA